MPNNKAQGWGVILSLIVISVIILVLFVGGGETAEIITKELVIQNCRFSIQKAAYSKLGFLPEGLKSELDCPRWHLTFHDNRLEAKIKKRKIDLSNYDNLNEEIVKRQIAELIKTCWFMVEQGELKPFDENLVMDKKVGCLVCAEISFGKDAQKALGYKKITDFMNFLKTKKIIGSDIEYWKYLYREKHESRRVIPFIFKKEKVKSFDSVGTIDPSKYYYLIYTGFRRGSIDKVFWTSEEIKSKFDDSENILGAQFFIEANDLESLNCGFIYN